MGAHIIILLFLLFILHDRAYFNYRPFFWCCSKTEPSNDSDSAEKALPVREHQLPNGFLTNESETSRCETPDVNDDVINERAKVYRVMERISSHVCLRKRLLHNSFN